MQLIYRGHRYEQIINSVATNSSKILVQYRGLTYALPQAVKTVNPSAIELKYRGIAYLGSDVKTEADNSNFSFQLAL